MFQLLSRVLLWMLIAAVVFSLFQKFYPTVDYFGRFVLLVVVVVLIVAFLNPNESGPVASLWRFISFPLKPLGASVLMLIFAAQKIKGGGIDKPGGLLVGWALTILLLSSTPAIAYFLLRSPIAAMAPPSALVAMGPAANVANNISDVMGNGIIPVGNMKIPAYLLQNPAAIERRGLLVEDFVPQAETLQLTTQVWESYLNQVYIFLRGRS
ncbi:hypothetical protein ACOWPH_05270 [Anabaena sp. PCC 7938]|uniref:Uncharacterized protein n=1 Tax=Anabaena cylindrica (strain ATCC 27899 / PCC 7122) TaxID=272123 RepID=K9ZEW0_ANACC|nr:MULTISPECIES: hypothetical protein [Anabaena]AFZ57738.1 hypothetical protein Anacy_2282 [Anabaena cylindrica PCC 7122]AZL96634.1 hypothetical protein [Anabaena sp. CCAP 1446/1C]MBY5285648.1 hypothetical protein [Anabaena sp. CCAP 1446/1C]MBY5310720.1 hypothetical protein [Anabaena sp. CCAP 1446/1C]MCM2409168.1 hypothetical protein [Anabaena sp. CCAP 1446/1C]